MPHTRNRQFHPIIGTVSIDYGGYFSDNPSVAPDANKLYRFNIPSNSWSAVDTNGDTVTRVAEGAAAVVPAAGNNGSSESDPTFFYFGGHLDTYTVQGWSVQVPRVYLNSMIEFDQSATSWTNRSSVSPPPYFCTNPAYLCLSQCCF